MTSDTNLIVAAESKPQMDAVREFMSTLDQNGQRSLLDFFQGAKFMQNLMTADMRRQTAQERVGA